MSQTMDLKQLAEDSVRLIRLNQHPSGGYVASPLFAHYNYSWLRDGSFIAYAMDCAGEHTSAGQFYEWVSRIVERKQGHIQYLLEKQSRGELIGLNEFLHTRYHLDGRDDVTSEWGHFQLDGYGTWLWGLIQHLKADGQSRIPDRFRASVDATAAYLQAFWRLPNFDCWEEHAEHIHPSTLACIYGGLKGVAELDGRSDLENVCNQIKTFLLEHAVHPEQGHFVKYVTPCHGTDSPAYTIGNDGVDASLMWLSQPFGLFDPEHASLRRTLEKIESDLRTTQGGIRRYTSDAYYGGGEWLLLTAWYGWVRMSMGDRPEALRTLQWAASKADEQRRLPEQVPDALEDRRQYDEWVARWGLPAMPLLWSHAMFLVVYHKLGEL
ncbi:MULTISPECIES: glycoside hydrolase family 15 protein [unclassified Paenibacillus]|uniref:glycoside hydrolase family 15 protein n=1 Tax=unclassified Paenibacillus TaxID=185978 RepID=UPI001AE41A92|nr:GH15 family glucan-1,4-alpha-glucosidase [Paenibacillus sp. PvP091]MBP1168302.1 GH15 family glucan-1,4-alpha-glucosidase [Paenibacillus sp. PvR098]MBP2439330.1 GH15 family glucan-1,4-alpha-glucosidase [Paenibacillus sp. PvP052]